MKKVQTKNKLKGFFGLFAAFAMAIGVGVSLAPREAVRTQAADTLVNSFNFLDGGSSGTNNYATTSSDTNVSYASDNPGGTSGTTAWNACYANLSGSAWTRLGGKLVSSVQTNNTTAWANIKTKFTFAVAISKVEILGAASFGTAGNVGNSYLQYSTNGTTWTTAKTITTKLTATAVTQSFDSLSIPVNSYLRYGIDLTASSTNSGVAFTGMKVYTTPISVSSITVSPGSGTIYSGGTNGKTIQLTANVLPANAGDKTVTWKTSNASFATVSASGLVTAVGPGTATITATANDGSGQSGSATINVVAKAIASLAKSGTASKLEYNIGEAFDPTGLTFTATYNNGDTAVIDHSQLSFEPETFSAGDTEVEVLFGGQSVVVDNIVVSNIQFTELLVSGTLTKSSYFTGDTFNPAGLTFSAKYSDGSTVGLAYEDITFEPSIMAVSTTSVVATYLSDSKPITGITVQDVVLNSISIKTPAAKVAFKLGEAFSHAGLTIDANYNSGTVVKSSGFVVSGVNTMKLGAQTATITFEGKTVTYQVSVTNVGASAGEYVASPGVYNDLYTGGGMWTTTVANFNMGTSYQTYNKALLSATDSKETDKNWTLSTSMVGTWGSGTIGGTTGANLGVNTQTLLAVPTYISNMTGYSSLSGTAGALYIGMNFDVANPAKFSMKVITEKAMDTYIVYSTNGGTSYSILSAKQVTSVNENGSTWDEVSYSAQAPIATSARFGVLLLNTATSKLRTRVGDISIQSYTPGSTNWVDGDFTPLQQASAFSDYVLTGVGEGAQGNCAAVLQQLEVEYDAMSELAQEEFDSNGLFGAARDRMAYLEAWSAAQGGGGSGKVNSPVNDNNSITATIIIGVIGLTTLAGYYFLQKKKEA